MFSVFIPSGELPTQKNKTGIKEIVRFYFYVRNEFEGDRLTSILKADGYSIESFEMTGFEDEFPWSLIAVKLLPIEEDIVPIHAKMTYYAELCNSIYDGHEWEMHLD